MDLLRLLTKPYLPTHRRRTSNSVGQACQKALEEGKQRQGCAARMQLDNLAVGLTRNQLNFGCSFGTNPMVSQSRDHGILKVNLSISASTRVSCSIHSSLGYLHSSNREATSRLCMGNRSFQVLAYMFIYLGPPSQVLRSIQDD